MISSDTSADSVDQPQPDEREDEVRHADPDRLEQGGLFSQPGQFEDAGSEVQHRVDARKLIEKRDQNRQQYRDAQLRRPESVDRRVGPGGGRDLIGGGLQIGVGRLRPQQSHHPQALCTVILLTDQPAGTFGNPQAHGGVNEGRKGFDAQHPPPGVRADAGQQCVRQKGDQNAEHDVELKQSGQPTATGGRCDFGDVQRRGHRRDADPQSADEPRDHEGVHVGRQSRPDGRDEVEHADPQQRFLAAEVIGRPASDEGADHGPPQRHAHRQPVQTVAERPQRSESSSLHRR